VTAPVFVVDSTGGVGDAGIDALLGSGTQLQAQDIDNPALPSASGASHNDIAFNGVVDAAGSVTLIFAGGGAVTTLNGTNFAVAELGVSGLGGLANMFGTIGTNSSPSAASSAFINPDSSNQYRFNNCAIGSTTCIVLPTNTPIQPQAVSQLNVLISLPQEDDIDAPLINVFDEERLCEAWLRVSPEIAEKVCR
jgi:hypothetical protein